MHNGMFTATAKLSSGMNTLHFMLSLAQLYTSTKKGMLHCIFLSLI